MAPCRYRRGIRAQNGWGGSARFFLLGLPFHRARSPIGSCMFLVLGPLLRLPPIEVVEPPASHLRIEHLQGAAARIDLVFMGEIGETPRERGTAPRSRIEPIILLN